MQGAGQNAEAYCLFFFAPRGFFSGSTKVPSLYSRTALAATTAASIAVSKEPISICPPPLKSVGFATNLPLLLTVTSS